MIHTVESLGLDRTKEFPKWWDDIQKGRALICAGVIIEAAQDRVAMRRVIRKAFPLLGPSLRDMDERALSALVENVNTLKGS